MTNTVFITRRFSKKTNTIKEYRYEYDDEKYKEKRKQRYREDPEFRNKLLEATRRYRRNNPDYIKNQKYNPEHYQKNKHKYRESSKKHNLKKRRERRGNPETMYCKRHVWKHFTFPLPHKICIHCGLQEQTL